MKNILLLLFAVLCLQTYSQKILSEDITYYNINYPEVVLENSIQTYTVQVETPYTLTVEQLNQQSLEKFEAEKRNYAQLLKDSETEYQKTLANHEKEVELAEKKYAKESEEFKALTLIERLAMTDQGKNPQLVLPQKPVYVKPSEPVYREPNINEHLIFDEQVLADDIQLAGYEKGNPQLMIVINVSKMEFKDNAGQTFYKQPTNLKVFQGPELIHEQNFNEEFQFLTSSASNTINLELYEKNNVTKNLAEIEHYINTRYGYQPYQSEIEIEYPKNNDREYDAFENAKIKAISAYRKLNENATIQTRQKVKGELLAVIDLWEQELQKANYKDKKALINSDVAKVAYFNILKVKVSLNDKQEAEKTLKQIQNHRIDLDFNHREEQNFAQLEEEIYKM